ncbi:hypothetical protein Rmag_0802 [Candidatus Ruthia magnifica str. Cm (Calyptogena magnifica)]|uniref:Uncharacterized protein n=1 Tax=Ruthia magnifica subsp. Calyptogena magnifica TaxID=413404 RepID=A1AX66_RUTMC|nr:hypothetical protein Rmag_0802 [Candidatus Ruthia magnifica str. Cm (Calyptogena magnifica)]
MYKIITSHGDNDHICGLKSVLKIFNIFLAPKKIKAITTLHKKVVVNRYKNYNINILNSSYPGKIEVFLDKDTTINQHRLDYARY